MLRLRIPSSALKEKFQKLKINLLFVKACTFLRITFGGKLRQIIYQTRGRVFHQDIQTLRSGLKN